MVPWEDQEKLGQERKAPGKEVQRANAFCGAKAPNLLKKKAKHLCTGLRKLYAYIIHEVVSEA